MSSRLKTTLKIVAGLGVAIVLVMGLIGIIALRMVPTGDDAFVSNKIHAEFEQAITTNLPPDKHPLVISSPRRNATVIIVEGVVLTDDEKHGLLAVAEGMGRINANRPIRVYFQTGTNYEAVNRP
jgi:hypothetical protein